MKGLVRERIRAICFDIDGTLHDTDDQFVLRLSAYLRPLRIVLPQKDPKHLARRIVMQTETPANFLYGLVDRIGVDDEIVSFNKWFYDLGLGKMPQPYRLINGVREMLDRLREVFLLSVVSARDEKSTYHFLEAFNIKDHFIAIATAQTCPYTKPFPDPIYWAAEKMGVEPEDCLMVGDTTVDILSGKAAGSQTVGVLCGFGDAQELVKSGADIILPDTSSLQKVLLDN